MNTESVMVCVRLIPYQVDFRTARILQQYAFQSDQPAKLTWPLPATGWN